MASNWAGSTRRDRLPPDWSTIRARILERDGHRCRWVQGDQRCTQTATDVDHIKNNDDDRDFNLRSLCPQHHRIKTAAEGNAARAKLNTARRRQPEPHPGRIGR